MRRSRLRSALLGLVILLVNASIVVAVVSFTGHRPSDGIELPPSGKHGATHTGTAAPTKSGQPASPSTPSDATNLAVADRTITIAVLGDGTGDEDGEWVQVLARMLGETRRVTLKALDRSDPTRYDGAQKFGKEGPATVVWNGSRRGVSADYAARRLDFLVPSKPDVVILNYGRDNTASNVGKQLSATYGAIRAKWPAVPVLVTLQAQDRDDVIAPVRSMIEDWAHVNSVPTVDVAAAFSEMGDPNRFVSVEDPPSVNSKGGRLWARTVLAALGGDVAPFPRNGALPDIWDTQTPAVEPSDTATTTADGG